MGISSLAVKTVVDIISGKIFICFSYMLFSGNIGKFLKKIVFD